MSAKQMVLDAVGAMPDEASWHDILVRLETLVSGNRPGVNGTAEDANAQLILRLYPTTQEGKSLLDAELDALAADSEMQAELRRIDQEFACTDWDGMEGF